MRAEILVGLMEDGGVPLEHADAAEEPLRRIIEASEWLLKGGNRRGQ